MKQIIITLTILLLSTGLYAQTSETTDAPVNDEVVYSYAEKMPEPPYDVYKKISGVLKYPKEAKKKGIEGKVLIQFVVDEHGKITNIVVKKSPHKLLSQAAVEAVSQLPKWKPGIQYGKPVKVYYTLPLSFKLK